MSPEKEGPNHRPCCSLQATYRCRYLDPGFSSLAGNGRLTLTSVRLFHDAANATHTAKRRSFAVVVMNLANLPHLQGRINRPGRSLELFVSPPLGRQIWHSWPWSAPIASRWIGPFFHSSVPKILQSTLVARLAMRFSHRCDG